MLCASAYKRKDEKMKIKKILSMLLCAVLIAAAVATTASAATYTEKLEELAAIIREAGLYSSEDDDPIMKALERYFTDNPDKFAEFANYVFQTHDVYSHYYTAEDYEKLYPKATKYVGIGVEMDDTRSGGNFIKNVFEGSPAEQAGILPGDEIVSVDGVDVTSYSLPSLTSLIRGDEGTEVVIGIRRENRPVIIEFRLTRQPITVSNIEFEDMGDGVAYIKILRFGDLKTFFDFAYLYIELPDMGFKSVIFDVRDNPGGSLDVLLNILNYIVPEAGMDLMSIYTRENGHEVYTSTGLGWQPEKMVVLVNENTVSAAEVFAGTLQNLGCAVLVGKQTYGKGLGQYHLTLEDGSVAIITNFEIKPAGNESYNGRGIVPDLIVSQGTAKYPMPKLGTLSHANSIKLGEVSESVYQLELRLHLLGYLTDTPDNTFDSRTLYAVQSFAREHGLRVLGYASGNMIYHLNLAVEELSKKTVSVDTQLETAVKIAKGYLNPTISH